jgi:hypothetical protein
MTTPTQETPSEGEEHVPEDTREEYPVVARGLTKSKAKQLIALAKEK